jgi:hypothetical protein
MKITPEQTPIEQLPRRPRATQLGSEAHRYAAEARRIRRANRRRLRRLTLG